MRRLALLACLAVAAWGSTLFVGGCDNDREVEHSRETRMNRNGTVETKEKTIRESPTGETTTEEEHSTYHQ